MVDDEPRVRIAVDQRGARIHIARPEEGQLTGKSFFTAALTDPVDARVCPARALASLVMMMWMPTVPGIFFHSGDDVGDGRIVPG